MGVTNLPDGINVGTTFQRDGVALDASAARLDAAVVLSETIINVDHPDYSGDIQACLDAHTAGIFRVPPTAAARDQTGTIQVDPRKSLVGEGVDASKLRWPSSLGADTWGIEPGATQGAYYHNTIQGLALIGPAYGMALTPGTANTDMHALKYGRRTYMRDVRLSGWHSGFGVWADHNGVSDSEATGNHHAVRFLDNTGYFGDNSFRAVDLAGQSMSSVRIDSGGGVQGSNFIGVHFGFAPYAIWGPSDRTGIFWLGNSTYDCSYEALGNGLIFCESSDSLVKYWYDTNGGITESATTYKISGTGFDYIIRCSEFRESVVQGKMFGAAPDVAYIACGTSGGFFAVSIENSRVAPTTTSVPFYVRIGGTDGPVRCVWGGADRRGRLAKCTGAATAGQLLAVTGVDLVDVYDAATEAPAGVAYDPCDAGKPIRIITSGDVNAIADGTVNAGTFVKPGTTAGRVAESTGWTDGPIVGVAWTTATDGNLVRIDAHMGNWGRG